MRETGRTPERAEAGTDVAEATHSTSALEAAEYEAGLAHDDEDGDDRPGLPDEARDDLFSRPAALSNREVLEKDAGLPRTMETVDRYAELAGVDFHGAKVDILDPERDADTIAYLDSQGAAARTDEWGVQLGPAAFADEETLVRALGHEATHVEQLRNGRLDTDVREQWEQEAYAAEEQYVERWRLNSGG